MSSKFYSVKSFYYILKKDGGVLHKERKMGGLRLPGQTEKRGSRLYWVLLKWGKEQRWGARK